MFEAISSLRGLLPQFACACCPPQFAAHYPGSLAPRASKIDVQAKAGDHHGAAILVVARVIDVVEIERTEDAAPDVRGVEAFEDFFMPIGERPVAQQKTFPAQREIFLMSRDDPIHNKRRAGAIISSHP